MDRGICNINRNLLRLLLVCSAKAALLHTRKNCFAGAERWGLFGECWWASVSSLWRTPGMEMKLWACTYALDTAWVKGAALEHSWRRRLAEKCFKHVWMCGKLVKGDGINIGQSSDCWGLDTHVSSSCYYRLQLGLHPWNLVPAIALQTSRQCLYLAWYSACLSYLLDSQD